MSNNHQGASAKTISQEECHRLDNRATSILQQHWPTSEISQWMGMQQGKQQAVACATLTLPTIDPEIPNDQLKLSHCAEVFDR
ncbi:hypothetical protein [Aeromonas piscicola]|uniref:hypothetical protein n=1 Tax=Aeromonas piscicola TaxID=600645 RepID=UPI0021F85965|nr:hypothetical protein [Aeromonas piscicola]MCW0506942.1 hypothetical protein [Aeromonas piscicola]